MASTSGTVAADPPTQGWQLPLDFRPQLPRSFESWVVGRNAEALTAVHALMAPTANSPEPRPSRMLYLWGEAGCGRSHLMAAMASAGAWWWLSGEDPARPGVALIDDVDALGAEAQSALFMRLHTTISYLPPADHGLDTLAPRCMLCGPVPPARLPLREDVRSRLAQGLVYRLFALNDDEMAAALEQRARARGATVAEDLVPWMLRHLPRDVGRLAAVMDALDTHALARRRPLTVPLLREWLARSASGGQARLEAVDRPAGTIDPPDP